jgi:hypothetical protein
MSLRMIVVSLLCLSAVVCRAAELPRYKHLQMQVYPAAAIAATAKGIAVDGALTDWQPGAFITMCADPDLKSVFSCEMAFAYTPAGLLLAQRVVDASPLINHNDPAVDPFRGWAGDALQLRLIADGALDHPIPAARYKDDAIVHLTLWYFTDAKLPTLDLRYGMDFHGVKTLTGKTSGLFYTQTATGYTLEGLIPWSLLTKTAPQPGARWVFTVQPQWGDAAGKHTHSFFDVMTNAGFHFQRPDGWGYAHFMKAAEVPAALKAQALEDARLFTERPSLAAASIPVKYTSPLTGFVSLAICTPDGQIVRTLLTKAARKAGPQTEAWDGLDDTGKPVPAGAYTVKALAHPGITPRFVCSVHNSGNPSWGNGGGRYGWGADHGNPLGAASDPEGNTYLLWHFNEGGNYLIQVDATGQKQWGANISWGDFSDGATTLAYDNGLLYVAKDGLGKDGRGHGGLFVYNANTGGRVNFPSGAGTITVTKWSPPAVDATPKPLPPWTRMQQGAYDAADLNANITGLAAGADRLYCSLYTENRIIALEKKNFTVVESYAVPSPGCLAYDAAGKALYAVSRRTVVKLDLAKDGAVTPFIADGLAYPYGLAVGADGAVWVSVRGTQMQVRGYDRAGRLVKTVGKEGGRPWLGRYDRDGMLLPAGISLDAKGQLWVTEYDGTPRRVSLWDPRTGKLVKEFFGSAAYAPMMAPDPEKPEEVYIHNTRFLVDYEKGTSTPDATVFRANYSGPTIPGSEAGYGFMGSTFQVARYGGQRFALNGNGGVFAVEADRFKPLLYIGMGYPGLQSEAGDLDRKPVVWTDANQDGLVQPTETRQAGTGWIANNIAQFGATFFPGAAMIKGGKLYRPTGLTPAGAPIYPRPEDAEPIITGKGPMTAYSNWMDVWPSLQSEWQDYYAIASLPRGGAMDGAGMDGIYRFTRNGEIKWRYSRVAVFYALKAPLAKTGDLYGALRIAGQVQLPTANGGEVLGIGVYRGYFGFLNEDGLFIDQVGYDNGRGPSPNFDVFYIENFSGYFFKHPRTGKVYLLCGDVDGRILELQGWQKITRLPPGTLTVTPAQAAAVLTAATTAANPGGKSAVTALPATPALDGTLKGWDSKRLSAIELDETHTAQAGLAYDATHLYALFKVPDATPWQNASTDWRYCFKGGDAVDVQLGAMNPTPEHKRKAQPGDVRVLLAPAPDGGITAVAMWSKAPAGLAKEPQRYQSPVGEESFERVTLLKSVGTRLRKQADGYTLEVAIPWSELGLTAPAKGTQLQGDLGVLLSDGSGARTTGRRYYYNRETTIINDIPSEVRVESNNWGLVRCE